ncbi:hypothetical protein ES707_15367 [subsurface metagenome]
MKVKTYRKRQGATRKKGTLVLGYARVSTLEQQRNTSLAVQRKAIKAYCKAQGWNLVHCYQDTSSGGNFDRFGISILEQRLNETDVAGVVVHKLDRLSRSILDARPFIDRLTESGKFLLSIGEGLNSEQPASKMILGLLFTVAEGERDRITERMTLGRNAHLEKTGQKPSGKLAIGYQRDPQGNAVFEPETADQVREAFRLKGQGVSSRRIASEVFKGSISHVAVFHLLKNRYYLGEIVWNTGKGNTGGQIVVTDAHPALISKRAWNRANGLSPSQETKAGFALFDNTGA